MALALSGTFVLASMSARAEVKSLVAEEYKASCAACHGEKGDGNGPVADVLKVKPTDLTTLSKRNNGKFPLLRVMEMIDGRGAVPAHGPRTMPVWGRRYVEEAGEKYGPYGSESAVRARILELVYYIQSLQKD
jgi:mono/diheme cytochrome c family protein